MGEGWGRSGVLDKQLPRRGRRRRRQWSCAVFGASYQVLERIMQGTTGRERPRK